MLLKENELIKTKLNKLIAKGYTERVIETLLSATNNPTHKKINNELAIISSQFTLYAKEKRLGLSTSDHERRTLARINHSLLEIIDRLDLNSLEIISADLPNVEKPVDSKKKFLFFIITIIASAVIITVYIKFKNPKPVEETEKGKPSEANTVSDTTTVEDTLVIATPPRQSTSVNPPAPPEKKPIKKEELLSTATDSVSFVAPSIVDTKPKRDFIEIRSKDFKPFKMAKYEVTVSEYLRFCKETGHEIHKDVDTSKSQQPITFVSWKDATAYCEYVGGRLPTVAEWEFAASGGNQSQNLDYTDKSVANKMAWYGNKHGLKDVGLKKENELGLFDMIGNVSEWCSDIHEQNPEYRKIKGGGWKDYRSQLGVNQTDAANLYFKNSSTGFRLVFD